MESCEIVDFSEPIIVSRLKNNTQLFLLNVLPESAFANGVQRLSESVNECTPIALDILQKVRFSPKLNIVTFSVGIFLSNNER